MQVLAMFNVKGGVGKTTSAVNLAYLAAREGRRTLLWDLDPQGAASYYLRIRPKIRGSGRKLLRGRQAVDPLIRGTDFEGFDLLPADISYRKMDVALADFKKPGRRLAKLLMRFDDEYELIFLDCPPGISLLAEAVFVAADALLVPTIPTPLSVRSLRQIRRRVRKLGLKRLRILPFLSLVDRRKKLHRDSRWVEQSSPFPVARAQIPYASPIEQMAVYRAPVGSRLGHREPAAAYERLWSEIGERLEIPGAA